MNDDFTASRFRTRDPEEALPVLARHYSAVSLSTEEPERFAIDHAISGDSRLAVSRVAFDSRAEGNVQLEDRYFVGHLLAGRMSLVTGRDSVDVTQPMLYPRTICTVGWSDLRMAIVTIDVSEVDRLVRLMGGDPRRHSFTGVNPISPALGTQWAAMVKHLNRDVFGAANPTPTPLQRAEAREELASTMLRVFPNTTMDAPDLREQLWAPANLRRALRFIEENATGVVTVASVAEASGYSIRGLQNAFRRSMDMTPLAYLRRVRLDAVYSTLRGATPEDGTIADIARRAGFTHIGRFTEQFRAEFGMTPRQTRGL
ncbi:AraC family transcriptional regulator [Okibacterium fritillariae]|uniref:AraC family transcriptional regulator n=1 Tax=Okibacterium fritillariae TaxID=123320 RepID=UPI00405563F9